MSKTAIIKTGEKFFIKQLSRSQLIKLDKVIFANISGINGDTEIDLAGSMPDNSQIVHTAPVTQCGLLNDKTVVYSVILDTSVGDFSFNYIGLANSETNTLCMVMHTDLTRKIKTAGQRQGNTITESIWLEIDNASESTGITVNAETWQIDYSKRLAGEDERIRLTNYDLYNRLAIHSGFTITKSDNQLTVSAGSAYVAGLRVEHVAETQIKVEKNQSLYVDAWLAGTVTCEWSVNYNLIAGTNLRDYEQSGFKHYVERIASVDASGKLVVVKPKSFITTYDRATTEKAGIVKLSSEISNTSEAFAATSYAVKKVNDKIETKFSKSGGLLGGSVKIDGELELNRNPCALIFSAPENNKKMILKNNNSDSFVMSHYDEKYWYDFFKFTAESKIVDFKHVNNVTIGNKSVLKKGDNGIGTQGMVVDSTNRQLGKSGFIAITANNDDKPEVNGGVCGFQSFSTNNGYGMQLVSTNNAEAPLKIFARAVENDKKVGEWVEILKKGDRGLFLHVQSCTKIDNLFQVTTMLSGERLFVKAENTKTLPSTSPGYLLKMGARDVGGGGFYLFCEYMENGAIWKGTNQAMDQPITWNMLMTDQSIKSRLNSFSPVGIPQPWPSETPPAGWLKCDGSVFDKNKYPLLAKAYPSGKLPDLRGEFIRGWNDGGKVDIGRKILSNQGCAIEDMSGSLYVYGFDSNSSGVFVKKGTVSASGQNTASGWGRYADIEFSPSSQISTATETRPRNIAFLYIVKAA